MSMYGKTASLISSGTSGPKYLAEESGYKLTLRLLTWDYRKRELTGGKTLRQEMVSGCSTAVTINHQLYKPFTAFQCSMLLLK
jgi:hypothetical protein